MSGVINREHIETLVNRLITVLQGAIENSDNNAILQSILDKLNAIKKNNPEIEDIYTELTSRCSPCVILGGVHPRIAILFSLLLLCRIEGIRNRALPVMSTTPSKLLVPPSDSLVSAVGGENECMLATYMLTNTNWNDIIDGICKTPGVGPEIPRPFSAVWGKTSSYTLGIPNGNFMLATREAAKAFPAIITQYLTEYPLVIPANKVAKIPINLVLYKFDEPIGVHTVTLLINKDSITTGDYGIIDPQHLGNSDGRFPYYLTQSFHDYILAGIPKDDREFFAEKKFPLMYLLRNIPDSDDVLRGTGNSFQVVVEMPHKPPPPGVALAETLVDTSITRDIREASEAAWDCLIKGGSKDKCKKECYKTAHKSSENPDFGGTVKRNRKRRKTKRKRQKK